MARDTYSLLENQSSDSAERYEQYASPLFLLGILAANKIPERIKQDILDEKIKLEF